jgi:hypothetical protein
MRPTSASHAVNNALWTEVQSELGVSDATLATLLSCSVEEVAKWRTGSEPTPDAVERHLRALCGDGGVWHAALVDRPKATRVLPGGRLSSWLRPFLLGATFLPFAVLLSSFFLGFTFTPVPWLGQVMLLVTAVITVRLALGLSRLMGPRCSLCGEIVGGHDRVCPGCQAELT